MPGAEPFLHHGDDVGCLCLHGTAASPAEIQWLSHYLADQGLTVYTPRLAGHGTHHRDLRHLRWQDWYMNALDGYAMLHRVCRQVFVVGHSMGGLLALLLAASEPVDGLVVIAAPLKANNRLMPYANLIKYVRPYVYLPDRTGFPSRLIEEQRRRGEPLRGRVRYDWWPSHTVQELYRLMRVVDTHLHGITAPALLLYSEGDPTVPVLNQAYVRSRLNSTVIETHTYERSGHILPQDYDYEDVLARTGAFINGHRV